MGTQDRVEAKVTHRFNASEDEVYDAWLNAEIIRSWMSVDVPGKGMGEVVTVMTDPYVGGNFLFTDKREGGEARHWGTYKDLHRPRRIVFTWITAEDQEENPSIVTIVLLRHPDGGTAVTLTHEMDAEWADYVGQTEKGWGVMLTQISTLLDRPF